MKNFDNLNEIYQLALNEYLNTPESERSLTKLGSKYGVSRQSLSAKFKQLGYQIINYQNKCRLNECAFDNMQSEEQFYWLGFLYADGNISSSGHRIEVRLAIKDLEHLEKFRNFLNLTTEIRTGICNGNEFCHLAVRNKHMWQSLNKLGCVPNKSNILCFPDKAIFNKVENVLHFIRGYVDGDGCLSIYQKSNGKIRTELNLVGTNAFLQSIKEIFQNKGYLRNKSCANWNNKAYSLTFSDVQSRKVARYLYQNANIYLTRKYNKFIEFCLLEEESSRRKSSKIGEGCDANTEITFKIA